MEVTRSVEIRICTISTIETSKLSRGFLSNSFHLFLLIKLQTFRKSPLPSLEGPGVDRGGWGWVIKKHSNYFFSFGHAFLANFSFRKKSLVTLLA
jgi:hypothetical protein